MVIEIIDVESTFNAPRKYRVGITENLTNSNRRVNMQNSLLKLLNNTPLRINRRHLILPS